MNKTKSIILNSIKETGYYRYSSDLNKRAKEQYAVKELEAEGLITSVSKSIGEVYAKPV